MATLTVRDLPDDVRDRLRVRAAEKGRSMEAEVRRVLAESVGIISPTGSRADWDAAVRDAQEAVAPARKPEGSVVDDLIAERHGEAERDEERWRRIERGAEEASAHRPKPRPETQAQKIERARAVLRRYVPAQRSLVDEFLAERRQMWGED